jgi:hypothetical protein
MVVVLREFGGVMHSEDLARVIAERDLYRRGDGQHPPAHQLRARAVRYPHLLEAGDDGSGRIALAAAQGHRLAELVGFCADVGSVAQGQVGWARSKSLSDVDELHDTSKPSHLVDAVCVELAAGRPVALGFECPLFVPVPADQTALGRARFGEGNRSWSAGAGTGALASGSCKQRGCSRQSVAGIETSISGSTGLLSRRRGGDFSSGTAFVTSAAKGSTHVDDAAIAVAAFTAALKPREASTISAERPLSLIGAAATWSGWSTDDAIPASGRGERPERRRAAGGAAGQRA